MRETLIIVAVLLVAGCASTATPPLATDIDAAIHRPPFQHAFWSILIEEDDGTVLYAQNADKLTMPASNRKLFASATVVSCLGADAQLATELWRADEDLILVGDGDPSLGSWRYERDQEFDAIADALRARGITRVHDVIADVSRFDRITIPGSWKSGNLGADYAAPVDALSWNENEVPVNRAVPDPGLHAATTLRDTLVLRGIEVTGAPRVNTEPRAWSEKLMTVPSPFIGQLLRTVLKNSHNLYAEMLLKRVGGGTYPGAFTKERTFLTTEPKIDGDSFRFVDGSGLAPDDLVTPQATVKLLRWMNEPSRRAFWWDVLATPNQDGTLHHRLEKLEDRLRGKTGTINGVSALSGILAMPDHRYRYFAIVTNHHAGSTDDAEAIIDSIVELIAKTSPRTTRTR